MKPVEFDYVRPVSVEEAISALHDAGGDGKIIAGGQSLVPLLNMRLARPRLLVDINDLPLNTIVIDQNVVTIGATVRQRSLEKNQQIKISMPLLAKCLPYIGHPQTRNRGTVVGSIVHADPSGELPLVATVLDAELELIGPEGVRTISIHDFYLGYMATDMAPDELALRVRFFGGSDTYLTGTAFQEVARRHGDFAITSAACELSLTESEHIHRLRLGLGGVGAAPVRLFELEERVRNEKMTDELIQEFAMWVYDYVDPDSDLNATSAYRRHLAYVLTKRVLKEAWIDAKRGLASGEQD